MSDPSTPEDAAPDSLVEELVDSFVARFRRGERPSITEYLQRYPNLAEQIEDIFPALARIEEVQRDLNVGEWNSAAQHAVRLPALLGDFRIIREVGHGGMGSVYEAEQVSLRRRVALKVLSSSLLPDATHRERFLREARAAARLHHTNIVPVFGVGDQDGVAYYVMQFIAGAGLDQVLKELQHQRQALVPLQPEAEQRIAPGVCRPEEDKPCTTEVHVAELVASLLTGQTPGTALRTTSSTRDCDQDPGRRLDNEGEHRRRKPVMARPCSAGRTDTADNHGSTTQVNPASYVLPGQRDSTSTVQQQRVYWESVARIGIQVAEALQYAHEQGVIHRDVKPANLLLDACGAVWVTDFGLAKTSDQHGLTNTGDVLGTLRYMAPEQFDGCADRRSDICSLGLTLYELLAFRPAFDGSDRPRLVRQISTCSPPKLRTLNSSIPRDLETIVHKAIERAPADRYQTAAELADDLRRYLHDEPIFARRTSLWSQLCRWCRKYPAVAILSGCLLLALGFLTHSQFRVTSERDRFRSALLESLVAQARFHRLSGEIGQRTESLSAIAEAASLQTSEQLRDDAIRCLSLHDLESVSECPVGFPRHSVDSVDIHPTFECYVTFSENLTGVREATAEGSPIDRLLQRFRMNASTSVENFPVASHFSPDGKFLAVNFHSGNHQSLRVWEWQSGRLCLTLPDVIGRAFAVNHTETRLICGVHRNGISWLETWDLDTGQLIRQQTVPADPFSIRIEPAGSRFAVTVPDAHRVVVGDLTQDEFLHEINYGEDIYAVEWNPTGKSLAVGRGFDIEIVQLDQLDSPRMVLTGHRWMIHGIQFHPSGEFMATHSLREELTRLWDLRTQRQLLQVPGHCIRFNSDGSRLALCGSESLSIVGFVGENEYQTLATPDGFQFNCWHVEMHPQLPIIVECGEQGLRWWDPVQRKVVGQWLDGAVYTFCFDPTSGDLLSAGPGGIHRWEVVKRHGHITISEPQKITLIEDDASWPNAQAYGLRCSKNGTLVLAGFHGIPELFLKNLQTGHLRRIPADPHAGYLDLSPDGRWIAVGNRDYPGFAVFDTGTDGKARTLSTTSSAGQVHFSPDGRQLIACANDRYILYQTDSWKQLAELTRSAVVEGAAAYSRDGGMIAVSMAPREVQLLDTRTRQVHATLTSDRDVINILNMRFSSQSDAALYLAGGVDGIRTWNLAKLRSSLKELQLDW